MRRRNYPGVTEVGHPGVVRGVALSISSPMIGNLSTASRFITNLRAERKIGHASADPEPHPKHDFH
jgi:hypothetical protein